MASRNTIEIAGRVRLPAARHWRWAALIAILWAGTFLRFHALDQLPPGLYHDEAFYALDAQRVLHDHEFAIFFTGNNGREPLHIYLLAGALAMWGDRVWALRLVSALAGLLAIPLIFRLGRLVLRIPGVAAGWAGVLAAAVLSVSYWPLSFSRVIFRAVDLVPLSLLAVWLLVEGARRRARHLYVLSGAALGLCLYTYLSARLLPVVFVGIAAAQFAIHWRPSLSRRAAEQPLVQGSLIALLVAAVVFAPLGAYFAARPQAFGQRSSSLSIFSPSAGVDGVEPPTLASNLLATARMFVDRGDQQARHNLPGRPALDLAGLAGFWVGLAAALLHIRQARSQLLLLWLGLMLMPTTLSVEAPHFLRAIGALPPACLLAASGLARVWALLARARPRLAPGLWPALIAGLLLASGALTYRDYFIVWPSTPSLAGDFNLDIAGTAQRALEISQAEDAVLPLELYQEPTALFFLEPVFGRLQAMSSEAAARQPAVLLVPHNPGLRDLNGLVVLRRPPGQPAAALVTKLPAASAISALLKLPSRGQLRDRWGRPYAEEIAGVEPYLPGAAQPDHTLEVTFDGRFRLRGYDLQPQRPVPGDTLEVDLYWESLAWAPEDYIVSLQIQSPLADKLAQLDDQPGGGHYNTTLWRPGGSFTDAYTLTVPAGTPPGTYGLMLGLYELGTLEQLPSLNDAGAAGESVRLAAFTLPDPSIAPEAIPHPQEIVAGESPLLKLRGFEFGTAAPGGQVDIALYWEALAPMTEDFTVFVHLLDESGALIAQHDGQPQDGRAPTAWWSPGDLFRDVHPLSLPADLPAGRYQVDVGLYRWDTGQRLPLFDPAGARLPDDRWLLPETLDLPEAAP
ncbi:MAG: glycosyltransferase family 39 protein [Anaerolineales bacterium]|nr:glycosyltransferase family 39 protein [Anaerolineales bacterium]